MDSIWYITEEELSRVSEEEKLYRLKLADQLISSRDAASRVFTPRSERARLGKPICNKGDACVNQKCTFNHPNRQPW